MSQEKIDFVLPWVNGADPEWQEEFKQYAPKNKLLNTASRFQDWDNLHYIFRAFEKFTPWVNKIFLITWGHLPVWLNIDHPKLVVVNHKDYISSRNLPIFSSHPIEMNLHKIKGLSKQFVYFNDDTFILKPLGKEEFFQKGLPVDFAVMDAAHDGLISHILGNNIDVINKNFNRHVRPEYEKKKIILNNFSKWFSHKYGIDVINNIFLMKWKGHTGFVINHHPQPYLKSTFEDVWSSNLETMEKTSASKFRSNEDVNQYLFRYWQLVTASFIPANYRKWKRERKHVEIRVLEDAERCALDIKSGKFALYCINDAIHKGRYTKESMSEGDFFKTKMLIDSALKHILYSKSDFEL